MSGLFTAAFLRQIGWDVDVFERSGVELVGRGAGITTHPELLEALEKSGAGTRDLGIEVERRITIDRHGRVIGERPLRQILTSWDRLQRLLRETIDPAHYHLGHTFERVEQDGQRRARAFRRRPRRARRPAGRRRRHPLRRARPGRAARCSRSIPAITSGAARRTRPISRRRRCASIFPYFVFFLPERQQVIGYPISGFNNDLRPGHRRYNFIWYRVGDAGTLKEMCVDENGHQHDYSVPPPLIRKDLIAQMRAEAEDIMPPAFVDCLRNIEQPFFTPIYDFSTPRIVFGRVALVGDAGVVRAPAYGVRRRQGGRRRAGARGCARRPRRHRCGARRLQRACASRSASASCCTAASSAPIWASTSRPTRTAGCGSCCRSYDAMMDWIAVPNFLAAYR